MYTWSLLYCVLYSMKMFTTFNYNSSVVQNKIIWFESVFLQYSEFGEIRFTYSHIFIRIFCRGSCIYMYIFCVQYIDVMRCDDTSLFAQGRSNIGRDYIHRMLLIVLFDIISSAQYIIRFMVFPLKRRIVKRFQVYYC